MAHRRLRLSEIRATMRAAILEDEARAVRDRVDAAGLTRTDRESIVARAVELVRTTRARAGSSIMQGFLAEYGLSTREGVALMCLAEALLRVPDTETIDALDRGQDRCVGLGRAPRTLELAAGQRLHMGAAADR